MTGVSPDQPGEVQTQNPSVAGATGSAVGGPADNETFQVGHMGVKNTLFDQLLNRRKLELLNDPEILSLLASSRKGSGGGGTKKHKVQ